MSDRLHSRRWTFWYWLGLSVLLAGCSDSATSPTQAPLPPITVVSGTGRDLFTTEELRAIPGVPSNIEVGSFNEAKIGGGSDPRGPCGRPIAKHGRTGERGVAIRAPKGDIKGAHVVVQLPPGEAEAWVRAVTADLSPGCAPFTVSTNAEATTTTTLTWSYAVHGEADGAAFGRTVLSPTIGTADHIGYEVTALLWRGDHLGVLWLLSTRPLDENTAHRVADKAASLLASS